MTPDHDPDLWANVPNHLRDGIRDYIVDHQPVGGFLTAVFENNLSDAVSRADAYGLAAINDILIYLWNCAPTACWGSRQKVVNWLAKEKILRF